MSERNFTEILQSMLSSAEDYRLYIALTRGTHDINDTTEAMRAVCESMPTPFALSVASDRIRVLTETDGADDTLWAASLFNAVDNLPNRRAATCRFSGSEIERSKLWGQALDIDEVLGHEQNRILLGNIELGRLQPLSGFVDFSQEVVRARELWAKGKTLDSGFVLFEALKSPADRVAWACGLLTSCLRFTDHKGIKSLLDVGRKERRWPEARDIFLGLRVDLLRHESDTDPEFLVLHRWGGLSRSQLTFPHANKIRHR